MMFNKGILTVIAICFAACINLKSQVSITNINVQAFNMTPDGLLNVGIMNNGTEMQVQLLTQVFNSTNTVLMSVKSKPFFLKSGLNAGLNSDRRILSTEFPSGNQSNYIKTSHNLPSGRYKICSTILPVDGADKIDDLCEELEAEFNQYLYLVNPVDGDTIETKNPLLSWTHSEPFTILNQGEFYRMIVTEIKKGQNADEAITVNSPAMSKNYLKEHQLQYPFDAKELKVGSRYAWQVQKLSDGVVVNKTEAWVFITRSNPIDLSYKYVALKPDLDGSYYTAFNGKVYFKFLEEYKTQGNLKFKLTDSKSIDVGVEITPDKELKSKTLNTSLIKSTGDNRYELDLDSKKLKHGYYTLEVRNEKNEPFYLKIFLQ